MTEFSRRSALSGAAVVAASAFGSGSGPSPAEAAAPPTGKQAPGFYRYNVGTHEVTVVTDGANVMALPEAFVVNAKKDEVNAALETAHLERISSRSPTTRLS